MKRPGERLSTRPPIEVRHRCARIRRRGSIQKADIKGLKEAWFHAHDGIIKARDDLEEHGERLVHALHSKHAIRSPEHAPGLPLPRTEVVSKVWDYINANNLQNPENKREILADDKLRPIFGGKDKVSMLEMNKHFAQHLS
jgi:hypothetical protein